MHPQLTRQFMDAMASKFVFEASGAKAAFEAQIRDSQARVKAQRKELVESIQGQLESAQADPDAHPAVIAAYQRLLVQAEARDAG